MIIFKENEQTISIIIDGLYLLLLILILDPILYLLPRLFLDDTPVTLAQDQTSKSNKNPTT